jgi:D-beta-D-heptose 7-phosphate kinase/D-beta-D-heptose 1-phosphate adenosyltransferase
MSNISKGFLSEYRTKEDMIILDYKQLAKASAACKALGLTVGLTQGSFDVKHIGHDRYLMAARRLCDVLFVGVDSDEKITKRKGPTRPIVFQDERLEQLCHVRWVNVVTLKEVSFERHALQKAVQPDVIIISTQTKQGAQTPEYSEVEIEELKQYCREVKVLEPQAPTSTTARIRTIMLDLKLHLQSALGEKVPELLRALVEQVTDDFLKPKKEK